jgi:hypothetical protein
MCCASLRYCPCGVARSSDVPTWVAFEKSGWQAKLNSSFNFIILSYWISSLAYLDGMPFKFRALKGTRNDTEVHRFDPVHVTTRTQS